MTRLAFISAAFAALAASGAICAPARAGDVCNETSFMVEIAMAWRTPSGLAAEGWTRVRPGECVEAGPETDEREQYLYARTSPAYLGGVREWRGGQPVCVDQQDFTFEGAADCAALGLEERSFRRLREEERRRATLVEPADYGARADDAGLQRLLQSAGFDVRVIDGYVGRRTRREIRDFESDAGRSFGEDRAGLMDALHAAALERNASAGLRICNEADAVIAAAVARPRGEGWESRGWWRIAPGACVRALAVRLTDNEAYVYAEKLADGVSPAPLTGGDEAFCIAPARFLAEGRGDCETRAYETAAFRAAPEPVDGASQVTFDDGDFEAPSP